jgi:hypothetical protein
LLFDGRIDIAAVKDGNPQSNTVEPTKAGPASKGSAAAPARFWAMLLALPTLNVTALVTPFAPRLIAKSCVVEAGQ